MQLRTVKSYFESTARQRIAGILDAGSFRELCPPQKRVISPHLGHFRIPVAFDDGVIVGEGRLDGRNVAVVAQEGRFMGGAIGEVHSAKIVGILRRCLRTRPVAMLFLFDSGGVRLQEANAGEIGVAEIIRALLDVRAAGIPVIGAVGGSCGCFGGAGIISACCDALVVSEEGRIGVSGPEVIETNMGVEVFDSRDRALVWRTFGGKNRYLQGAVQDIVENSVEDFRTALARLITLKSDYTLAGLQDERKMLEERAGRFAGCRDGRDVWGRMGFKEPEKIPALGIVDLKSMANALSGIRTENKLETRLTKSEAPSGANRAPELLKQIFPDGSKVAIDGNIIYGEGTTASGAVEIIGTINNTAVGIREILQLSERFINVMLKNPGRPILMLVDNSGQRMALEDELLGLNQYIAHLVKLQDLARRLGHKVVSLVYGNSIAGGFIAFGLCAGQTYALPSANTSVMILPAIARVTKLPLEYLEELSKIVPVFAPGVKNFYQTGGLQSIWEGDLNACLEKALKEDQSSDTRAELGMKRCGRTAAFDVSGKIANGN